MAKSAFQIVIHKKIAECFINKMDSGSQFLILVEVFSYFTYAYIFAEDDPKLLANFYAACWVHNVGPSLSQVRYM